MKICKAKLPKYFLQNLTVNHLQIAFVFYLIVRKTSQILSFSPRTISSISYFAIPTLWFRSKKIFISQSVLLFSLANYFLPLLLMCYLCLYDLPSAVEPLRNPERENENCLICIILKLCIVFVLSLQLHETFFILSHKQWLQNSLIDGCLYSHHLFT